MPDWFGRFVAGRNELDLYTGTLIKDLLASVERAEQAAALRSHPTSPFYSPKAICHASAREVNSEAEKFTQALRLSAADWNLALLLIVHAQLVGTFEPGHNFANPIDVHQVGAMGTPEQARVQARK